MYQYDFFNRSPEAHKYTFGHVLVIGGSPGMIGAPLLAAEAALRTGAGLATIAASPPVVDKLERRVTEVMTYRLPESAVGVSESITSFAGSRHVQAVVIGPGLSTELALSYKDALPRLSVPIVMDGGMLAALQADAGWLRELARANPRIILTPHAGEFARLVNVDAHADRAVLEAAATTFARAHGVTVVLKGHRTCVTNAQGDAYHNETGNPGMATAGSGDVLAGVIGGLLAQGVSPWTAATNGVYVHGLAGDKAAHAKTQPGMVASDIVTYLPEALAAVQRGEAHFPVSF